MRFADLYKKVISEEFGGYYHEKFDINQLNCLLRVEKSPVEWDLTERLLALSKSKDAFHPSHETLSVLEALSKKAHFMQIIIAPAFLGQFSSSVTPGMLRQAFKKMGFDGMVEAAIFADILTLKEALEFDHNIKDEKDFQLASCCCPMWIAMIKRLYPQFISHLPKTVSPMIAAGRTIKLLHPGTVTVFVGPCIAKKMEAKEPDILGAIDYVLTFQEVKELIRIFEINLTDIDGSEKEFSSKAGRIYAYSGGVSRAVEETLKRLSCNPARIKTIVADGMPKCKEAMNDIVNGQIKANFYEGMGCIGGCIGGPKSLLDKDEAKAHVQEYGDNARYKTPVDNPYVIELLHRLGFYTTDGLLLDSEIFTRYF